MMPVYYEFSGKRISMSVTFGQLYQLQYINQDLYRRFFQLFANEDKDLVEKAELLYIAYACANLETDILPESQFYTLLERDLTQVSVLYSKVFLPKLNYEFQKVFKSRTRLVHHIKLPKYELADIEDYYSLYVLILGIPENTFWDKNVSFVCQSANNKSVFEEFLESEKEKLRKRALK